MIKIHKREGVMSNTELYELLYTSKANPEFKEEELRNILSKANEQNEQFEISGMLIYYNHCFVQILEGKKLDILNLFKKISKDHRHHSIEVFYQGEISERSFENWSMAGKALTDQELIELLPEYEPLDNEHLSNHILNSNASIGKALFLNLKEKLTS